jgi:hypothetical protein
LNPLLNHINFAELINDDLERLSRYIAIDLRNFSAFSNENARLLLSCCAEIESMFKQLLNSKAPTESAQSIDDYFDFIVARAPDFCQTAISSSRLQLSLQPFSAWLRGNAPHWWAAHNKVKHHRHQNFEYASLENVVNAVAAFEIVLRYYFYEMRLVFPTVIPMKFHSQRLFSS